MIGRALGAAIKETHHFYPVLFYFRFQETFYSVSHMTLMALDTAHLGRGCTLPGSRSQRWIKQLIRAPRQLFCRTHTPKVLVGWTAKLPCE